MVKIRPGSHAASLVASIMAEREAATTSSFVKPRRGLTTDLPVPLRRPIIIRQAQGAESKYQETMKQVNV
jgi:hypothetical protein